MERNGASTEHQGNETVEVGSAPAETPHRKRPVLLKLTFSLVLLVALLGVVELTLRCLSPMQLGFEVRGGYFEHPREFVPDPARNHAGFHDAEHGPKQPGARRVLLLGDSYVHAYVVPVPEIPGQRLQHYLNQRSKRKYEVVSIGGGGWGQAEEITALRERGLPTEPDIVLTLFLSLNDVSDNYPPLKRRIKAQQAGLERQRLGQTRIAVEKMPSLWLPWSRLNQLISHRLAFLMRDTTVERIPLPYFVYARHDDQQWQDAWRDTEELFVRTQHAVESAGAHYAVVAASTPQGILGAEEGLRRLMTVYPGMQSLEWDLDKPDHRVEQLCRFHGIPFLALEPIFREEAAKGRQLHFKYDGHWTADGIDLAAQRMADFLLRLEAEWNVTPP